VAVVQDAHPKRLDERVAPGWAGVAESLLRYGGIVLGLFVLWLGFLTGGFFMLLTGVLAGVSVIGGWLLGRFVGRESWYSRSNAQPLTALIVVAFPIALIAFAQIAGPLLTPPPTLTQQFSGELGQGDELVQAISVDPRVVGMEFSISIPTAQGGAVRWYVQDPTGQSRWSGRTDQYGNSISKQLDATPGQWTLHVVSEADHAEYSVDWKGWTATDLPNPAEIP
jgi:hypothetical protein